ncbi:MAG: ATP-grasp domain-containing protein [Archaeoglobales archaeon]|nr:ATP-grasp domain-containing protein [Archaeoglobales archaeon]
MKVFLYEHATCFGDVPESIAVEGLAMYQALYRGLAKFGEVRSVYAKENFLSIFERGVSECDAFIIVAPENNLTLFNLTKIAERYAFNLGSSSKAIKITSDKWRLYKKIKRKVNIPKTSKKPLDCKYVVKPRISCGGVDISLNSEIKKGYIAQEFIEGKPISVSVAVGDEIIPLSINEQIIENFEYFGGVVPAKICELEIPEILDEAIGAVEAIRGLYGYVGVDLILAEQPYVIELNARLTTPAIVFEYVYGITAGEIVWRNAFDRIEPLQAKNTCIFKKSCEGEIIAKVGEKCLSMAKL